MKDGQQQVDADSLLVSQRREQGVLAATGPAPLEEDTRQVGSIADTTVRQVHQIAVRLTKVGKTRAQEGGGQRPRGRKRQGG